MAQVASSQILVHAAAASPRRTVSATAPQAAACLSRYPSACLMDIQLLLDHLGSPHDRSYVHMRSWSPRAVSHAVRQGRPEGTCSAEGRCSHSVVDTRRPGASRRCTHATAASDSGTGPTSNDVLRYAPVVLCVLRSTGAAAMQCNAEKKLACSCATNTEDGCSKSHAGRVSLPTSEAQRSIKFALARAGRETAVIINRLSGGSAAAEVGRNTVFSNVRAGRQ